MRKRNFTMQEYWINLIKDHQPELAFRGNSKEDWMQWRSKAYPKLMELLGEFPEKVPLNAEVEYSVEEGDLIRERVIFDVDSFMSLPCYVLKPKNMKADKSNAAIICSHGHGPFGKDPVAGVRSSPEHEKEIKDYNYNFGEQMAKAGFLTLCPDLRMFGERSDGEGSYIGMGGDSCNDNFIKGVILGVYTLTLNIWDIKCCIDYLETRPEVDKDRIGMMGISGGGTMTTFTAAVDNRIKAADIIGYVNPWASFGIQRCNFCGSQIVPGIYRYFDTDEIAGLIAPRPLLVEMGIYDKTFLFEDLIRGYMGIEEIYRAAGAESCLWKDVHPGGHSFSGAKAFDFFRKYL